MGGGGRNARGGKGAHDAALQAFEGVLRWSIAEGQYSLKRERILSDLQLEMGVSNDEKNSLLSKLENEASGNEHELAPRSREPASTATATNKRSGPSSARRGDKSRRQPVRSL